MDFAGPFLGHMFLIVVDAYSKWPEVIRMKSTTAQRTVDTLRSIFAIHGLPLRIVTDNGPQFVSKEFADFCGANGVQHTLSAPYHPATNGEAERFVQTFKKNMKCRSASSADVDKLVCRFLITYRTTPHTTTGMSPSSMLMGRRIRTRMDLLKPDFLMEKRNLDGNTRGSSPKVRSFKEGEDVLVRVYGKEKWAYGNVEERQGDLHYQVNVGGRSMKRHVDQLRATEAVGAMESASYRASDDAENPLLPPPLLMARNPAEEEESTEVFNKDLSVPAFRPVQSQASLGSPPAASDMPALSRSPVRKAGTNTQAQADSPTVPVTRQSTRVTRGVLPARYRE